MITLTITVNGGLIQDIEGIPEGMEVVVMDFDTEGVESDDADMHELEDGTEYIRSVWGPPEG